MPAPRSLLDGQKHDVYAYGINHASGGPNTLLTGSPKSFTCAAPAIGAGDVKRHVVNPTILADWRFDTFLDMAPYTTAELAAVAAGDDLAAAPDVVQASGDPAVYVVDGGHRRHIVNPDSLAAWRLTSADIKPIAATALAALVDGPDWPLAPLLAKDPANPAVYMLDVPLSAPAGSTDGGAPSHGDGGGVAVAPDAGGAAPPGDDAGSWSADGPSNGAGGGCSVADPATSTGGGATWLGALAVAWVGANIRRRGCRPRPSSPRSSAEPRSSPGASARRSAR
jgi:MYXO-CTERM domain-containing protein